ncbi:Pollen Ole e 1 allergen and extensin family protein [Euphorbia peplus]|nr:Pollen Ole e 1 allergen and extensin family protein [Euphorbia peplus]
MRSYLGACTLMQSTATFKRRDTFFGFCPSFNITCDAMVSGTVFCDQCKDGQRSLFDYPISGIKVRMGCENSNGEMTLMSKEETTNLFGSYAMRLDGSPDLSNCYAQVVSGNGNGCASQPGPAQKLRLTFRMFDMEFYNVDSLLTQPARPISSCPNNSSNPPRTPPTPVLPIPVPPVRAPPLPKLPPMPFLEPSACSHQKWLMAEYRCYWRAVNPDTKVAVIFGGIASRKYGTDITLWQALQGRGDPYKTLLREATTALLNSYNSLQFSYNAISVVAHTNSALMGSQRAVLLTALRFIRANSGSPSSTCKFTPCK